MTTVDLRLPDLRVIPIGTTVVTKKGFQFKLVGKGSGKEIWKDVATSLYWFFIEEGTYTHFEAMQRFNSKNCRVPTKREFEEAEKHGFRDVVPDIHGRRFWASCVSETNDLFAYDFCGRSGLIGQGNRKDHKNNIVTVYLPTEREPAHV